MAELTDYREGGWSPSPRQSLWYLWWTEWYSERFLAKCVDLPVVRFVPSLFHLVRSFVRSSVSDDLTSSLNSMAVVIMTRKKWRYHFTVRVDVLMNSILS